MHTHCCKEMDFFLDERKVGVGYSPKFRIYYINLKRSSSIQIIQFCPWCGTKLPKVLDREWCRVLEKAGFENPLLLFDDPVTKKTIPNEFKTDEWWKKRGL